jgi:hypothetical protein
MPTGRRRRGGVNIKFKLFYFDNFLFSLTYEIDHPILKSINFDSLLDFFS